MTVPTKTLLSQLRGEVVWAFFRVGQLFGEDPGESKDHADAALDIIEELEGREGDRLWNKNFIIADLRRLHDLIKGSAPREAMELIRAMIGEER